MKLIAIEEAAALWKVSMATARRMCNNPEGCPTPCDHCKKKGIPDGYKAHRVGSTWVIEVLDA
jgi:hypothetical protein